MFAVPTALQAQFEERLLEKAIPEKTHWFFVKVKPFLKSVFGGFANTGIFPKCIPIPPIVCVFTW